MIRMVIKMTEEISAFSVTFGTLVFTFFITMRMIHDTIKKKDSGMYEIFLNVFDAFNS